MKAKEFNIHDLRKIIEKRAQDKNVGSRDLGVFAKTLVDIDKHLGTTKEGEWFVRMEKFVKAYEVLENLGDPNRFEKHFGCKLIFDNRKKKDFKMEG